ncbi:MAG: protein arginine kinase [Candidatus Auribacterota bacterium]|jgi:protein arginine kinase|uniref:Protein-arginine kinase n=1 Tax=Candidatus Auribacter fodinae TaxID=2093366 RepID=A0A3A4QRP6_9BACT|nr:MAG: protein arginine kinase [Candidatus Auribacter fodinae]
MDFNKISATQAEWLLGKGPNSDIVMSSRIRLARNLKGVPFPQQNSPANNEKVIDVVFDALKKTKFFKNGIIARMQDIPDIDKQILFETHLISKELITHNHASAIAISAAQDLVIMVNEEDHLRIQVLKSGFNIDACWELINKVDSALEKVLDFAYSPSLGYLTACPTNVGTGMRASVMLHLPGLMLMELINKVMQAVIKLGLAVRGFYGEGSEVLGNLFQISNQTTLGKSEKEIIANISKVIDLMIEHERNARAMLNNKSAEKIKDTVGRSYGILCNAHIISSKETISLLSALRMGMDMGYITGLDTSAINELFIQIQPAHLQKISGELLDPGMRDVRRAQLIRERLRQNNDKQS